MGKTKIWYSPNSFEAYGEEEIDAVVRSLRKGWLAGTGEDTVNADKDEENSMQPSETWFHSKFGFQANDIS